MHESAYSQYLLVPICLYSKENSLQKSHQDIIAAILNFFFKSNFVAWSATPTKLLLQGEMCWKIKELFVRVNAIGVQHFVGNLPSDLVWFCYQGCAWKRVKNITRFRSESSCVLGFFCWLFFVFAFCCGFKIVHQVRCLGNQWQYNSSDLNRNQDTKLLSRLYTMIYILDKVL